MQLFTFSISCFGDRLCFYTDDMEGKKKKKKHSKDKGSKLIYIAQVTALVPLRVEDEGMESGFLHSAVIFQGPYCCS